MSLLELDGVEAGYGSTQVLRGVSLAVPAGQTVVLLGPNGAGKTTLLNVVAGLVPTTGGQVRFDGRPLLRALPSARARAGVCLIPEGRGIFRHLSVQENLVVFAGRGAAARAAVERVTALFPVLGERLRQAAGTLSGGQQQMLAMARALISDAPLILADELSMGLAPVIVDEVFEALAVLRAEGRSLLLVEQYVERAVGAADFVYILNKGNVVFAGEPAECASSAVFARYLAAAS